MQIGPISPVLPTANKTAAPPDPTHKQVQQRELAKPPPFNPNPALRPTLQDRIDVNRTMRVLRQV